MEFKFLGVWFDDTLKWNSHINWLMLKLKRNCNLLKTSRHFLNKHALLSIYYTHICSHLNYGLILWGNMATRTQINKLQKVQNKCVSYIMNKKVLTQDFKLNKLLTIDDMLWINNVKIGYKLRHSHVPVCVSDLCLTDSKCRPLTKKHWYNTSKRNDLYHPSVHSKHYESSYLVKAITLYNQIPESFNKLTSISSFVHSIKSYHFLS